MTSIQGLTGKSPVSGHAPRAVCAGQSHAAARRE
jgi:hypothetical protein